MKHDIKPVRALLLFLGVAALGIVIFFLVNRPDTERPAQTAEGGQTTSLATVRYDGRTFSPQRLRVPAGTRVTFVNVSGLERPLYIASDPHPTHENYPGFDARVINGGTLPQPGASQSFTFTRPGVWGYHDHNFPTAVGAVEVF